MVATPREVKARKKALRESGHTMADAARLANVSWRMAKYWYDGKKRSDRLAKAHASLTGVAPATAPQPQQMKTRAG